MDSFTSRVIAFALPALGIVISGQHPNFFVQKSETETVRVAEQSSSTITMHDPLPAKPVQRHSDVETFLDAGQNAADQPAASELRVKTDAPWLSKKDGELAFMNRLPPDVDDELAPPKSAMVALDSIADDEDFDPNADPQSPPVTGFTESSDSTLMRLDEITETKTEEHTPVRGLPSKRPGLATTPAATMRPVVPVLEINATKTGPKPEAPSLVRDFYRDMAAISAQTHIPESDPLAASSLAPEVCETKLEPELTIDEKSLVINFDDSANESLVTEKTIIETVPATELTASEVAPAENEFAVRHTALAAERVKHTEPMPPIAKEVMVAPEAAVRRFGAVEPSLQPRLAATANDDRQSPHLALEAKPEVEQPPIEPQLAPEVLPQLTRQQEVASTTDFETTESSRGHETAEVELTEGPVGLEITPESPIHSESLASRETPQHAWTPVDIRTIEVDTNLARESRPAVTRATREDQTLARKELHLAFELVQRRAPYSARARFVEAMRIVARSLDEQSYSTKHSTALSNALTAYEEANDFFPTSTRPGEDVNLHVVIGAHETHVLQQADPKNLTPRRALREYLAYSEQEFVMAFADEELASQALYGLGRLEAAEESTDANSSRVRAHRSLALHQTALLVNDSNYAAANELGVLLAKYGEYEKAVEALRHCVHLSPQPTAWKNLSTIYSRMGRSEDARLALAEANRAMAMAPGTPFAALQPRVQWVDADTFASISPQDPNVQVATRASDLPRPVVQEPVKTASKSRFWSFGRKR